jgi:DNA polymerase-1
MQLVTMPNVVSMYDTMKDKRSAPDEVGEKFGVRPEKMIDLQSLAGDSVDNMPGVPGIGPKTAAQLARGIRRSGNASERNAERSSRTSGAKT